MSGERGRTGRMTRRRLRGPLGKVALSIASLLFALGLVEIGLRVFGARAPLSSEWILESRTRHLDDDVLTVEERFLKEELYQPFRAENTKAIVALGDSFTQGVAVDDGDSYPSVLETLLRARWADALVLNAGVGDTGPDQQLRFFKKYVLPKVRPKIVVWQLYPNDTFDNVIKPVYDISEQNTLVPLDVRDNWMYRRQRFYQSLPLPSSVKQGSRLVRLALRRYERDLNAQVPPGVDRNAWGRRKLILEIDEMRALGQEHGFELHLVLVAPQSHYRTDLPVASPGTYERNEHNRLLGLLGSQPNFIDATFGPVNGGDPFFDDGSRDSNVLGARHFNKAGYELLARAVAARLLGEAGQAAPATIEVIGPGGSRRAWMRSGWQGDESWGGENHVWSDGPTSIVEAPLPTGTDLEMTIECQPLVVPGAPPQRISILVGGRSIEEVTLQQGPNRYHVRIPAADLRPQSTTIEFRYAWARRLSDLTPPAADTRELAVAWARLRIAPARPVDDPPAAK